MAKAPVEIDRTTKYARDVIAGKIVAGELVVAACHRHLRDLIEGPARNLVWQPDAAERMINSYPQYFTITDGPLAGEVFELLEWMLFVTGSLFGWHVRIATGELRWRFDEAYIETGKGAGKSPWMACTGLLAMAGLGRQRAQIVITGPKDEQAMVTMADAAAAVRSTIPGEDEGVTLETLGKFKVAGLGANAHAIEHVASRSTFKTMSGNATKISGPRPDIVMVDEVHELVTMALIDMWQAALAKNARGGLLIACTNTPATSQAVGTYYSERAQRVAQGHDVNDSLFVFICRVDVLDRETVFDTPAVWPKSMPALGVTFPPENIEREVAKARLNPSEAARVKRLFFGIPTGAVDFWLDNPELWDRAQAAVDADAMRGLRCWLALDLSEKHDLTALTATWEVPESEGSPARLVSKSWFWTCSANIESRERKDGMPYRLWQAADRLNVIEGDSITKDFIAAWLADFVDAHEVEFLAFDVAGMHLFVEACDRVGLATWVFQGADAKPGKGLKLVRHSQGSRRAFKGDQLDMPSSIEALEDELREGTLTIDDSPVMYACAANAAPVTDTTGNRSFDKKRSRGRIDGIVTQAMSVGAAKMSRAKAKRSVYEERGIVIL